MNDELKQLAEEVLAKAEKATPRPWEAIVNENDPIDEPYVVSLAVKHKSDGYHHDEEQYICQTIYDHQSETYRTWSGTAHVDDAIYIAISANAAPQLAQAWLDLQAENERLRGQFKRIRELLDIERPTNIQPANEAREIAAREGG